MIDQKAIDVYKSWRNDWCKFAKDVLLANLDPEQQEVLRGVQTHNMVSVASGTARGKDFVAAVAALCFMYLTPTFSADGELVGNTKIALTAPTDRQIKNIMYPEVVRLFNKTKVLPGRLVAYDIRTDWEEWFMTGFKADEKNQEAWSGFHAVNTMFIVTEASGINEEIYKAIEGNLQGNSKILIVFNPNSSIGYAARSMSSVRWKSFRLDDLTAPNVLNKKIVIPGQVNYEWVKDKVFEWCVRIEKHDFNEGMGDFEFEDLLYRPNDLFRVKVRGLFPEVSTDTLIPLRWIELANERWKHREKTNHPANKRIGVDVAGMGRDSSVICRRFNDYVEPFFVHQSGGKPDHMFIVGIVKSDLVGNTKAFIDTIGEGGGVYSRLLEQGLAKRAISCKFSESGVDLHDVTGQFDFVNMKSYLYWAVRDWLNPANGSTAALPLDYIFTQEAVEIKYTIQSNGKIAMEPKEDTSKRLGRSPDLFDALANTFYPDNSGISNVDGLRRFASALP